MAKPPQPGQITFARHVLGSLAMMALVPINMIYIYHAMIHLDASVLNLIRFIFLENGWHPSTVAAITPLPTWTVIKAFTLFVLFHLVLLVFLPGKTYTGPVDPSGHTPIYKDNAVPSFFITIAAYYILSFQLNLFSPAFIYENLGPLLTFLNLFGLALTAFLYFKAQISPSPGDRGSTGNVFVDIYWGVELYPRIWGVDLKQLFIARCGISLWCLFAISFLAAQKEVLGGYHASQIVSAGLQFVYLAKFYYWEKWYMNASDIAFDRYGFMLAWGTIAFMPFIHTLQNLFLVTRPIPMSTPTAIFVFALGCVGTWMNYEADTQRHRVRSTDGKTLVWGRPPRLIRAKYTTSDGTEHTSLLLASGYNGISRHFHYVPDIMNLTLYCGPAGFTHLLPWTYAIYLTILLVDRTWRIDDKCRVKYGRYWEEYCRIVPYKLIPYVF